MTVAQMFVLKRAMVVLFTARKYIFCTNMFFKFASRKSIMTAGQIFVWKSSIIGSAQY